MFVFQLFCWIFLFLSRVSCRSAKTKISSEGFKAEVFCEERGSLIRSKQSDVLVSAHGKLNESALLQCKYCEEPNGNIGFIWYKQVDILNKTLLELDFVNHEKNQKKDLTLTDKHSLVIHEIEEGDIGVYVCRELETESTNPDAADSGFTYLLDVFFEAKSPDIIGDAHQWLDYQNQHFEPAQKALKELEQNIHWEITSDWGHWTDCQACGTSVGVRQRIGKCAVKPSRIPKGDVKEDEDFLKLSCRSLLLQQISPQVFNVTHQIPEYIESEYCSGTCAGQKSRKHFKYKKTIIVSVGAHLVLVCPEATIETEVKWEYNKKRLRSGGIIDQIPGTNEVRTYVDSYSTLYLYDVQDKQSGNYTCFVNNKPIQQIKLVVTTKSILFSSEFARHLGYLALIFVLCIIIYIAGVIITCFNKSKFKKIEDEEEKTGLLSE